MAVRQYAKPFENIFSYFAVGYSSMYILICLIFYICYAV